MMNTKTTWCVLVVLMFTPSVAVAKDDGRTVHRFLTGHVKEITGPMVTFGSQEGNIEREFSLNQAEENGISGLKVGDRLFLRIDIDNLIAGIDRLGANGVIEDGEDGLTVVGHVASFAKDRKTLTITLPNGEKALYRLSEPVAEEIAGVKTGSIVKAEIDRNNMIDDLLISR